METALWGLGQQKLSVSRGRAPDREAAPAPRSRSRHADVELALLMIVRML